MKENFSLEELPPVVEEAPKELSDDFSFDLDDFLEE